MCGFWGQAPTFLWLPLLCDFFFFFGQIIAMISEKKCVCWGVGGQAAKGCAASGRFWKGVCIDLSYCYTRPLHGAVLHGHV